MNLKFFLKNLAHTLDAPDAIPSLRRTILDLAVRGKLVPQNSKEKPASKLLKQIHEEKIKLEEAGKIKSAKPLPSLINSEKPFSAPAGWEWTRLENIGLVTPKNICKDNVNTSFIPMNLIFSNYGKPHESRTCLWKDIKKGFTHFAEGDVGVAKITPCFENGKSTVFKNLDFGMGAGTTELHIIRPIFSMPEYVLIFLKSRHFIDKGIPFMTGTAGQKRVPKTFFVACSFPLPPLAEQKRIVAKVDVLISLCDQLEVVQQERDKARERFITSMLNKAAAAPAQNFAKSARFMLSHFADILTHPEHVKELRRSILDMAVRGNLVSQNPKDEPASKLLKKIKEEKTKQEKAGEIKSAKPLPPLANSEKPFPIPAGWKWAYLHHIGNIFNGNSINAAVKQEKYSAVKNGIPFIATKDVKTGWQKLNYENGISIPKNEPGFKVAHKNAVLICSEGGSAGKKCGFAARDIYFGNKLIANELYGGIESDFVLSWYQTASFSELFTMQMKGIIGGISANNFKSLNIPIPPLAEQKRIVAKVNALMALCDQLELALADSRNNRRRLLNSLINTAA